MNRTHARLPGALVVAAFAILTMSGCDDAVDMLQPVPSADEDVNRQGTDQEVLLGWAPRIGEDWLLDAVPLLDTCGIGSFPANQVLGVAQRGIALELRPIDTAGSCGTFPLELATAREAVGDWFETVTDGDGRDACVVEVATAFRLDVRGDTITAREDNVITYVSGDCGEFTESCEWSIEATGVTCANCVPVCGVSTEDPRVGGPLGWPVDVALASLRNAP